MQKNNFKIYVSPLNQEELALEIFEEHENCIVSGLFSSSNSQFLIKDGIPDFTFPKKLSKRDQYAKDFYEGRVDAYEQNLHLTFDIQSENEEQIRNRMIDAIELRPDSRVLEIACGTGRDSVLIAKRLGVDGQFFLQDISLGMVCFCRNKLERLSISAEFSVGSACFLPFPDRYFDAVYSFGAIGEFSDIRRSLAEMVRVTKLGGRIGIGDESMPPWLRDTTFSKILATTNPQFMAELPLKEMPVEARDVRLRWVIGGVFYFIDFKVGEGEPKANFDLEIPGPRGGTLRTRYNGQLEGVTSEAKALAYQSASKRGLSMHKWLDDVVRAAAKRDLEL